MERIATRLEEAAAAATAGEFGFTVEEAEAASLAGEEEPAGHDAESSELAEDTSGLPEIDSSSAPPLGSSSQAEPPAPPRGRLRKAGDVVERQTGQQLP